VIIASLATITILTSHPVSAQGPGPTLDPTTIPKYVTQLIKPPVYQPCIIKDSCGHIIRYEYKVNASEFQEQILPPGFPTTTVFGYGGIVTKVPGTSHSGFFRFSPGATFETIRNIPVQVKWVNDLKDANGDPISHILPVDPTIMWADPNNIGMQMPPFPGFPPGFPDAQTPVPMVPHVHGAEVQSTSDGGPNEWFTANGIHGPDYYTKKQTQPNSAVFYYPNRQDPATIWYHDHALGMTRLNVYAGLAGFFLIRQNNDPITNYLPNQKYEYPIAIQDRSFNDDGSLWYPTEGINPDLHPYWYPEFFGTTIMVNGQTWPNLNTEARQYRFRILDGSNARFYTLSLYNQNTGRFVPFTQIGTDGGYLPSPALMTEVTIAPGERIDIIVDFHTQPVGSKIIMTNTANAPYPSGDAPDPATTGQIMRFTVVSRHGSLNHHDIPAILANIPQLVPNQPTKIHTLYEVSGVNGPNEVMLDGQSFDAPVSELPRVGSTQDWIMVDTTMDAHPMHLHLVQFQLMYRQNFDAMNYTMDWLTANGGSEPPFNHSTVTIPITPYLQGSPIAPHPNELGWKDTYQVYPGQIAVFRIRWAPQDVPVSGVHPGQNLFSFDPRVGPGYVWHCHIVDHEDNEMMRPYTVRS
jgi:spore coat protein A, manganese oxidase